jgi:PIN domain nuclease of toxin-antitoxin system
VGSRPGLKLLLDTHIWLWALLEPGLLTRHVASEIESAECELWLSAVSVWEALLLFERGRIELDREASRWLDDAFRELPLRDASLTRDVARASRAVHVPHDDPADRFLAATAVVYDLMLVTSDERLLSGSGYHVVANR